MSDCIECGGSIRLPENPMVGEVLACASCGIELEVSGISPLMLQLAPEIDEDWGE